MAVLCVSKKKKKNLKYKLFYQLPGFQLAFWFGTQDGQLAKANASEVIPLKSCRFLKVKEWDFGTTFYFFVSGARLRAGAAKLQNSHLLFFSEKASALRKI